MFHIKNRIFREVFFFFFFYNILGSRVEKYTSQKTNIEKDSNFFFSFDGTTCKLIFICREHLDPGPKMDKLSTAMGRMYLRKSLYEKATLKRLF